MFDIQKIVDDALLRNNAWAGSKRPVGRFNVSDAGLCYRARTYKRLGVPSQVKMTGADLRKMMSGTASHEKIQYLLKRTGNIILAEDEVGTEHRVGHPDGVIIENGEMAVIDFKTIEKWAMGWIKKKGAKKNHELQLFTYWVDLRKIIPNLNHGLLFYMKREDWEAKPFNYIWNDNIEQMVNDEWNPLIEYWVREELPPCTCSEDYDGAGVKYCKFATSETQCCSETLYTKYKISNRPIEIN